jgi:hypothetical protein
MSGFDINNLISPTSYAAIAAATSTGNTNNNTSNSTNPPEEDFFWRGLDPDFFPDVVRHASDNDLDRNAFMMLLVTQLQHQDPLSPMENTDFIAQLAQFSSLEQMQQMNQSTLRTQAFNMVGRDVIAQFRNEATGGVQEIIGQVHSVTIRGGDPYVVVVGPHGARTVSIMDVRQVGSDVTEMLLGEISRTLSTSQNMDLVGQHAQFIERDEYGEIVRFFEGRIDSLRFCAENGIVLNVGSEEVTASRLLAISDGPLLLGRRVSNGQGGSSLVSGPIERVGVNANGTVQLTIGGDSGGVISINDPTHATNALRHVGVHINYRAAGGTHISGVVVGVEIVSGNPRLVLDTNDRVCFLSFIGAIEEEDSEDDE